MADKIILFHNANRLDPDGDIVPVRAHDIADGTGQYSLEMHGATVGAAGAVTVAAGDDVAEGSTTDAAASSTAAETATVRTGISLWKGIKNILILINTAIGALTETAPGTDTASSGLNGRLQRIAQNITSLIALLPAALAANGGLKVEGVASGVPQPTSIPSAGVASGAIASGAVASGAVASGAIASGAVAAGAVAVGAFVDGAIISLGGKADNRSTATDTTAVTAIQVLKEISYMEQNPAARAVTGTFYQATQPVSFANVPVGVDANPVLTVAGAYSIGDFVGTSGTPMTLAGAASANGLGGKMSVVAIDKAAQGINGKLLIFDATVTPPADNAAWTLSAADAAKLVAIIPISSWVASGGVSLGYTPLAEYPYKCAAAATSLYAAYITDGTPTYASLDLIFRFVFHPGA